MNHAFHRRHPEPERAKDRACSATSDAVVSPQLPAYAGTTLKLMSVAVTEWVNAPTEMKSTPVSA